MKLAEALNFRKELQTRISNLQNRLQNNAKVQHGQLPVEDPHELMAELARAIKTMDDTVSRINQTNTLTLIDGRPLGNLVVERDLKLKHAGILRKFLGEASSVVRRYSNSEILVESTVNVQKLQKSVDEMSREIRELDNQIQHANWTTELI